MLYDSDIYKIYQSFQSISAHLKPKTLGRSDGGQTRSIRDISNARYFDISNF